MSLFILCHKKGISHCYQNIWSSVLTENVSALFFIGCSAIANIVSWLFTNCILKDCRLWLLYWEKIPWVSSKSEIRICCMLYLMSAWDLQSLQLVWKLLSSCKVILCSCTDRRKYGKILPMMVLKCHMRIQSFQETGISNLIFCTLVCALVITVGGLAHSSHHVRDILKQEHQTLTSPGKTGYWWVFADTKLDDNDQSVANVQSCF